MLILIKYHYLIWVLLYNLPFLPLIVLVFYINPSPDFKVSDIVPKYLTMFLHFEHIIKGTQQLIDCDQILVKSSTWFGR